MSRKTRLVYDQSISQIFQSYFWRGFAICKLCVAAAAAAVSWSVCRGTAPRRAALRLPLHIAVVGPTSRRGRLCVVRELEANSTSSRER